MTVKELDDEWLDNHVRELQPSAAVSRTHERVG